MSARDLAALVGALDVLDLAERHALATAGWTLAGDVSADGGSTSRGTS